MSLSQLHIHHVRNISSAKLTFHPRFNFFHGPNGSGKTTVLECLYLLSTGHSFRTRETAPLIAHDQPQLTVFGRCTDDQTVSLSKTRQGDTQIKLNQSLCYRTSELALFLPSQVFYQDIFQIIDAGPAIRRQLLDWGLFHVKQSYFETWKTYQRLLKQRNALLRQQASQNLLIPWDQQLAMVAEDLHLSRQAYFQTWSQHFETLLSLLTDRICALRYYKGWDKKEQGTLLKELLQTHVLTDLQRQYTTLGPHQADIYFDLGIDKAKQTLSRGQQKVLLLALKLAQARILPSPCMYLFDDMTLELDPSHVKRWIECLKTIPGQFFFTAIDPQALLAHLDPESYSLFDMAHVCLA